MLNLSNLIEEHEYDLSSEELQIFQKFIDEIETLETTTKSLTKGINIKKQVKLPLYEISQIIVFLAVNSFDSTIQNKCVELASALRDLRKSLLKWRNKTPLHTIFGEMTQVIGDLWDCKYLISLIYLPILDTKYHKLSSLVVF